MIIQTQTLGNIAAEINKKWVGGYNAMVVPGTKNMTGAMALLVMDAEGNAAAILNDRGAVTGYDEDIVDQLEYMLNR